MGTCSMMGWGGIGIPQYVDREKTEKICTHRGKYEYKGTLYCSTCDEKLGVKCKPCADRSIPDWKCGNCQGKGYR